MNIEEVWDNYKGIMWIIALYDMPTGKKDYAREYRRLRKFLLSEGFTMEQYSVYMKHCPGMPHVHKIKKKLKKFKLKYGVLMTIVLTDKQFGMIEYIYGTEAPPKETKQEYNIPSLFSFLSENVEIIKGRENNEENQETEGSPEEDEDTEESE